MAVPKRKTPRSKTRMRRASSWRLDAPARSLCPNCARGEAAAHRLRQLRLVPRPPDARRRLSSGPERSLTVTDRGRRDGGRPGARRDRRGRARRPSSSSGSRCCSWASRTRSGPSCPAASPPAGVEIARAAAQVIEMHDEPGVVGAHEEGRVGRARGRGGARRPRRRDGRRRATPARRWPARCCASAGSSGVARPGDRGADPGAVRAPAAPRRRRCDGRLHARVAAAVRAAWAARTPRCGSASTSRRSVCSRTVRRRARATTCASRRSRCSTATRGSSATSRAAT